MYFSGKPYFQQNREITTITNKRTDTQRLKPKSRKKGKSTRKKKAKQKYNLTKLKKQLGNDMVIKLLLRLVEGKAGARPVGRPPQQLPPTKQPRKMRLARGSGLPAREKPKLEKKKPQETEQQFFKRVEDYVMENNPAFLFFSQMLQQDRQKGEALIKEQLDALRGIKVVVGDVGEVEEDIPASFAESIVSGLRRVEEDTPTGRRKFVLESIRKYTEDTGNTIPREDEDYFYTLAEIPKTQKGRRQKQESQIQQRFQRTGTPRRKARSKVVKKPRETTLGELAGEEAFRQAEAGLGGLLSGSESDSDTSAFARTRAFDARGSSNRTPEFDEADAIRARTPPRQVGRPRFAETGRETKAEQLKRERQELAEQQFQETGNFPKGKRADVKFVKAGGEQSGTETDVSAPDLEGAEQALDLGTDTEEEDLGQPADFEEQLAKLEEQRKQQDLQLQQQQETTLQPVIEEPRQTKPKPKRGIQQQLQDGVDEQLQTLTLEPRQPEPEKPVEEPIPQQVAQDIVEGGIERIEEDVGFAVSPTSPRELSPQETRAIRTTRAKVKKKKLQLVKTQQEQVDDALSTLEIGGQTIPIRPAEETGITITEAPPQEDVSSDFALLANTNFRGIAKQGQKVAQEAQEELEQPDIEIPQAQLPEPAQEPKPEGFKAIGRENIESIARKQKGREELPVSKRFATKLRKLDEDIKLIDSNFETDLETPEVRRGIDASLEVSRLIENEIPILEAELEGLNKDELKLIEARNNAELFLLSLTGSDEQKEAYRKRNEGKDLPDVSTIPASKKAEMIAEYQKIIDEANELVKPYQRYRARIQGEISDTKGLLTTRYKGYIGTEYQQKFTTKANAIGAKVEAGNWDSYEKMILDQLVKEDKLSQEEADAINKLDHKRKQDVKQKLLDKAEGAPTRRKWLYSDASTSATDGGWWKGYIKDAKKDLARVKGEVSVGRPKFSEEELQVRATQNAQKFKDWATNLYPDVSPEDKIKIDTTLEKIEASKQYKELVLQGKGGKEAFRDLLRTAKLRIFKSINKDNVAKKKKKSIRDVNVEARLFSSFEGQELDRTTPYLKYNAKTDTLRYTGDKDTIITTIFSNGNQDGSTYRVETEEGNLYNIMVSGTKYVISLYKPDTSDKYADEYVQLGFD